MKMLWGHITREIRTYWKLWLPLTVIAFALLYAITATYLYNLPPASRSITGVPVTAVFVDIDKDGTQDLLVYGEVIYNPTPLAVTQ
jgi:hypothetical protein